MIKVNRDVCIECMTCVTICPFTVLEESEKGIRPIKGKICIDCMHCGAVCPTDAISYKGESAIFSDELPVIGDGFIKDLKNHVMMRGIFRKSRCRVK